MIESSRSTICDFANDKIVSFHENRLRVLENLELRNVLKKKNPYLFRAKHLMTASELISSIMDAFLSSSEEKLFGDFLEDLAIHVSEQYHQGHKSSAQGLDLEFDRGDTRYLVSIKSGPNWGNSSQYRALREAFRKALVVQSQRSDGLHAEAVLGICYGKTRSTFNGHYWKYTGQAFWHFLSGDPHLYLDIIEPIGHHAKRHNEDFDERRCALINRFSAEFIRDFCDLDGNIDWPRLVRYNSGNMGNKDT